MHATSRCISGQPNFAQLTLMSVQVTVRNLPTKKTPSKSVVQISPLTLKCFLGFLRVYACSMVSRSNCRGCVFLPVHPWQPSCPVANMLTPRHLTHIPLHQLYSPPQLIGCPNHPSGWRLLYWHKYLGHPQMLVKIHRFLTVWSFVNLVSVSHVFDQTPGLSFLFSWLHCLFIIHDDRSSPNLQGLHTTASKCILVLCWKFANTGRALTDTIGGGTHNTINAIIICRALAL